MNTVEELAELREKQDAEAAAIQRIQLLQERMMQALDKANARAQNAEDILDQAMTLLDRLVDAFQHELGMKTEGVTARVSVGAFRKMREINEALDLHFKTYKSN